MNYDGNSKYNTGQMEFIRLVNSSIQLGLPWLHHLPSPSFSLSIHTCLPRPQSLSDVYPEAASICRLTTPATTHCIICPSTMLSITACSPPFSILILVVFYYSVLLFANSTASLNKCIWFSPFAIFLFLVKRCAKQVTNLSLYIKNLMFSLFVEGGDLTRLQFLQFGIQSLRFRRNTEEEECEEGNTTRRKRMTTLQLRMQRRSRTGKRRRMRRMKTTCKQKMMM